MQKISKTMAVLLFTVAICIDGIQALVGLLDLTGVGILVDIIVNDILIGIGSALLFYIWLKILNVSFVDPKRVLRFFGSYGVGSLPVIGLLPMYALGIVLTIASVWAEEALEQTTGIKVAINAHLAVGNPHPVANYKDFAQNPKGFANNLDSLKHTGGPGDILKIRNMMRDERGVKKSGGETWQESAKRNAAIPPPPAPPTAPPPHSESA